MVWTSGAVAAQVGIRRSGTVEGHQRLGKYYRGSMVAQRVRPGKSKVARHRCGAKRSPRNKKIHGGGRRAKEKTRIRSTRSIEGQARKRMHAREERASRKGPRLGEGDRGERGQAKEKDRGQMKSDSKKHRTRCRMIHSKS